MPYTIVRQDITKMQVDAIVNAANTDLLMGGGVCGAIFNAAGVDELTRACAELAPISTGEAVITSGFQLPAKYIIHTAGPVYQDGTHSEAQFLRNCYRNSLELASSRQCESIAFPLISSGIYGYPKAEALSVASSTIQDYLRDHELNVFLAVFDPSAFHLSEDLLGKVQSYIDETYVEEHEIRRSRGPTSPPPVSTLRSIDFSPSYPSKSGSGSDSTGFPQSHRSSSESDAADSSCVFELESSISGNLDDMMQHLDESFSATLLRLVDRSGKSDAEIYKRANIDRRLFSKIRSNFHYTPSKATVIAFAIALELSLEQTEDLLERAGFALSHARKFDVIVEYFISQGKHDIYQINEVLFTYDQPLLGG